MSKDDELGMAWWNSLTERERTRWANLAGTGRAKDAWEMFKLSDMPCKSVMPACHGQGRSGAF